MNENKDNKPETQRQNPLLREFDLPPFDQVTDDDFKPAMLKGMEEEDKEIESITSNPATPTFANTIEALDHSGKMLERVSSMFFNLCNAAANDKRESLEQEFSPILTKHNNDIMLNEALFKRVAYVHDHRPEGLSTEEERLLDITYKGFVRNGALLSDDKKLLLRQYTQEFSQKALQFSMNLLHARKNFTLNITDEASVKGVPDVALAAAREKAQKNGHEGWDITLDESVYGPFMTYSPDRECREKLYRARNSSCLKDDQYNNLKICEDIVNLRLKCANLLGYRTYADFVLERRMAQTADEVYNLLHSLTKAYMPQARKDVEAVRAYARKLEGDSFELQPWDYSYYSHKLQLSLYDIDSEMLRPYFELSKVEQGIFGLASYLYGISFTLNTDAPVYSPDVKAYTVKDQDGSLLGTLYVDYFPRDGKQGGAWTTGFKSQYKENGKNIRPVAAVVMNLTRPTSDKPSLLTLGEVSTFLHEFGHSLHALFANTTYRSLSGTSVYWDFVELPSQFMENFAIEKKFLSKFAKHYATGEPLPEELIDKVVKSRHFNVGYATMRQVAFGLIDMALHTITSPINGELMRIEQEATKDIDLLPKTEGTGMAVHFSHIMDGGYAAGYYSYKWAEVIEADAFKAFKEDGVFSKKMAQRFRDCILSKGGTEPPMTLYVRFRGKKPTIDAMMERDGLKDANNKE